MAIKLLLMFDEVTTDRVLKEVTALAQLRHPNLILFMGFCLQPRPAIVCEFMQRGSLFKVGGPQCLGYAQLAAATVDVLAITIILSTRRAGLIQLSLHDEGCDVGCMAAAWAPRMPEPSVTTST